MNRNFQIHRSLTSMFNCLLFINLLCLSALLLINPLCRSALLLIIPLCRSALLLINPLCLSALLLINLFSDATSGGRRRRLWSSGRQLRTRWCLQRSYLRCSKTEIRRKPPLRHQLPPKTSAKETPRKKEKLSAFLPKPMRLR